MNFKKSRSLYLPIGMIAHGNKEVSFLLGHDFTISAEKRVLFYSLLTVEKKHTISKKNTF